MSAQPASVAYQASMSDGEPKKLFVCDNVDCCSRGSLEMAAKIEERLDEIEGGEQVEVQQFTCFGGCDIGPNMIVYPDRAWYCGVQDGDLDEIVAHLCGEGPRLARLETADKTTQGFIFNILDAGGWGSF
jgi:(2Fe-2S) ferredoxin